MANSFEKKRIQEANKLNLASESLIDQIGEDVGKFRAFIIGRRSGVTNFSLRLISWLAVWLFVALVLAGVTLFLWAVSFVFYKTQGGEAPSDITTLLLYLGVAVFPFFIIGYLICNKRYGGNFLRKKDELKDAEAFSSKDIQQYHLYIETKERTRDLKNTLHDLGIKEHWKTAEEEGTKH